MHPIELDAPVGCALRIILSQLLHIDSDNFLSDLKASRSDSAQEVFKGWYHQRIKVASNPIPVVKDVSPLTFDHVMNAHD